MSRLYATIHSDTNARERTITGNECMDFHVYYGSKNDSKKFIAIEVSWSKDADKPTLKLKGV